MKTFYRLTRDEVKNIRKDKSCLKNRKIPTPEGLLNRLLTY